MTTFYYDPTLDVHHRLPVAAALTTSFYAAPQEPDDALRLFEAGCTSIGFDAQLQLPLRPNRAAGSSLVLAKEWGFTDLAERLAGAIDASYEPTWDKARGEFTWGMGLGEPHPRGQFNAFLAAADASGIGMWTRLSEAPLDPCPQIVGVDFPTMAFTRAEWVDGDLHIRLAPLREHPTRRTSFRIVGAEPRNWDAQGVDGLRLDRSATSLEIEVPVIAGDLKLSRSIG